MAFFYVFLFIAAGATATIEQDSKGSFEGKTLIFYDDFSKGIDFSIWKHEITMGGGGNWEFEYYINNRSNSFVQDSILYLKPTLSADRFGEDAVSGLNPTTVELWGGQPADICTSNAFYGCSRSSGNGNLLNPIQSARLRTANAFSFKYGRLEVEAKLPRGDWIWPAIWLLPEDQAYGVWPASGEIDLMESRGNDASYPAGGNNCVGSTLHYGPHYPQDGFLEAHEMSCLECKTFSDEFHTFGLVWNENEIYTYVDNDSNRVLNLTLDVPFWERGRWSENPNLNNPWRGQPNAAPFDQKFYLIFNVAVGGVSGYFPDGQGGKPWSDTAGNATAEFYAALPSVLKTWNGDDVAMQIRSVSVWQ